MRPLFIFVFLFVNAIAAKGDSILQSDQTQLTLDGVLTPVYFNDGDTFRILQGPRKGKSARVEGINSLESYGPVHQWGSWTGVELYRIAKQAGQTAKRGKWHCTSQEQSDSYGRLLVKCPDLNEALVGQGLAHALFMEEASVDSEIVALQKEAIASKYGMWAKDVPEFILTSLHSVAEVPAGEKAYDRLVLVSNGVSFKNLHTDNYGDCQMVCQTASAGTARKYNLEAPEKPACMLFVGFSNRFGPHRAPCLN